MANVQAIADSSKSGNELHLEMAQFIQECEEMKELKYAMSNRDCTSIVILQVLQN